MTHCSDDDLVLQYYGEADHEHVRTCGECAARLREMAAVLESLTTTVPERGDAYGSEVWQRIRPELIQSPAPWYSRQVVRWAMAAAAGIALVFSGYVAGRFSTTKLSVAKSVQQAVSTSEDQARKRMLLLTVADHLEHSDRVLTEIMNAPDATDISAERQWAQDLVAANRLYRQDAADADERSVADVLDDLERALLDIVHGSNDAGPEELDRIRGRIDSAALLFKVRVMTNELRQRQLVSTRVAPSIG